MAWAVAKALTLAALSRRGVQGASESKRRLEQGCVEREGDAGGDPTDDVEPYQGRGAALPLLRAPSSSHGRNVAAGGG